MGTFLRQSLGAPYDLRHGEMNFDGIPPDRPRPWALLAKHMVEREASANTVLQSAGAAHATRSVAEREQDGVGHVV
eukprot:1347114-Alexandrium_andersonii.AAC.1